MTSDLFKHANARVAGSYLQPLLETAAAAGVSSERLAEATGLAHRLIEPLPESLAAEHYVQLLACAAQLSNDPCFGLHVGERVKLGTYSVYGLILLSCHNIGQALQQTLRYEGLAHDLGRSRIVQEGELARYQWDSHFPQATRHLVESVFAGIRVFGTWLTGQPLPASRICFTHPRPHPPGNECTDEYMRVLGRLPEFSARQNLAEFDAAILALPVPNADVSLYPVLRQHAEQLLQHKAHSSKANPPDIVSQVRQIVMQNLTQDLGQDQVRLGSIAAALQITPRTLQRKLSDAGASFQQILDQTRFQLAQDYLRQPHFSLTDIAFLLGYQEQSSFNHAFKEWSGLNPGAWREQNILSAKLDA
jgi:AraC-like DNA-binding protein